ncbi:T9SS type B sorting domain-containing protein [uncultured Polaribacter sp.]|uniref:T9SS type B sorting domain-containing protein n=1 Tax=uncultured Polaribacter sp. TaxID=174711 RepID=UPI0026361FF7|nr:T9SS type B sorting domain-containing protein [uncultured Polaribacter sp.]
MKTKYLIFLLFISANILSQTRTDNWCFGENAGINISAINHDVTVLNNGNIFAPASVSSISSTSGEIILYTNGSVSVNNLHQFVKTNKGIGGDFDRAQSTIIIPKPNAPNIYYIFAARKVASPNIFDPIKPGLYYTEYDANKKEIIKTRTQILDVPSTKLTAVHHNDGKSIWLVSMGLNTFDGDTKPTRAFFSVKISENGIDKDFIIKKLKGNSLPNSGAIKLAPNGTKIAFASLEDGMEVYNFNNLNGNVSNSLNVTKINPIKTHFVYGLEFSPNSKYIYSSSKDEDGLSYIHQYDLNRNDFGYKYKEIYKSLGKSNYGALQLAINGKIYHSVNKGNNINDFGNSLDVIENPDELADNIKFTPKAINLGSGKSYLGLPNFIQSYFNTKIITEKGCINLPTKLIANSYAEIEDGEWDFGDGSTGVGANPSHIYTKTGKFTVNAILSYDNQKVRVSKEIEIFPLPEVNNGLKLIQCDVGGTGEIFFNLNDINPKITDNYKVKGFVFYEKETDAIKGINQIPNSDNYKIKSNIQEIFVRVVDLKGCYSIASFELETTNAKLEIIEDFFTCEDSDGIENNQEGMFDLVAIENTIRTKQNIPNTTSLRFFTSLLNAQITKEELKGNYNSTSKTIWVRSDNKLSCGGIEPFNLVVNSKPIINIQDSYTICVEPSKHTPIYLEGNSFNDRFEWRNSNGVIISTDKKFLLNTIGNYSLTAYKTENNIECSSYKEFKVSYPDAAVFNQIDVDTETDNNIVSVSINGNSNYEFSLDNQTFFGNGTNYTFTNVIPGLRTIYVKDINNCEPSIQTNASVIGFNTFFTPNGDGSNDYWNLKGLDSTFFKSVNIIVFDRFGKILFSITDFNSKGWDGTYNGKILNANDYWFKASIIDLNDQLIEKSGNFSLIRN